MYVCMKYILNASAKAKDNNDNNNNRSIEQNIKRKRRSLKLKKMPICFERHLRCFYLYLDF